MKDSAGPGFLPSRARRRLPSSDLDDLERGVGARDLAVVSVLADDRKAVLDCRGRDQRVTRPLLVTLPAAFTRAWV